MKNLFSLHPVLAALFALQGVSCLVMASGDDGSVHKLWVAAGLAGLFLTSMRLLAILPGHDSAVK